MSAIVKLQEDLQNCLINFNNRVRITDLLEQYEMSYNEASGALQQYMEQQKTKHNIMYEACFIVYGEQTEKGYIRKIYRIVEEKKLEEWLDKLEKSTSMLYSIQIQGGAKPPPEVFVPLSINKRVTLRETSKSVIPKAEAEVKNVKEAKEVAKPKEQSKDNDTTKVTTSNLSSNKGIEKPSPKLKKSPPTPQMKKQQKEQKATNTKGINKYFNAGNKKNEEAIVSKTSSCPAESTTKASEEKLKQNKSTVNQSSSSNSPNRKGKLNASVPLFEEEEEEKEDVECVISSDEEEKIEALRRDIISSDIELEDVSKKQGFKRRRIEDSDDNDDVETKDDSLKLPPEKMEKLDDSTEKTQSKAQRITYLDEDDFVVTIRGKSSNAAASTSTSSSIKTNTSSHATAPLKTETSKSKSPNIKKKKSSPIESKKSTSTKNTKQANLTSYFKKK